MLSGIRPGDRVVADALLLENTAGPVTGHDDPDALVDFALNNRFLILAAAALLTGLGRDLVPQSAGGSLSRRGQQLR